MEDKLKEMAEVFENIPPQEQEKILLFAQGVEAGYTGVRRKPLKEQSA